MSQTTSVGRGSRVAGRGYQQLRAWQKAHALALRAFAVAESLRPKHRWLASQLTRSAVSVAANIAEGYNRGSLREYIQFLNIARGSLGETEYHILFARDAGLLPSEKAHELNGLVDETGSLLLGLIRSLQAKDGGRQARMIRENSPPYAVEPQDEDFAPASATQDPRPSTRPEGAP